MNPLVIVLIVFGVLAIVALGGCVACGAIIGNTANKATNELSRSIRESKNRHSVTDAQVRAVELGATRGSVESQFGAPERALETGSATGSPRTCLYYNVRDSLGDEWQLCFTGAGQAARLDAKNRF